MCEAEATYTAEERKQMQLREDDEKSKVIDPELPFLVHLSNQRKQWKYGGVEAIPWDDRQSEVTRIFLNPSPHIAYFIFHIIRDL
jgi:hypothetical protein